MTNDDKPPPAEPSRRLLESNRTCPHTEMLCIWYCGGGECKLQRWSKDRLRRAAERLKPYV